MRAFALLALCFAAVTAVPSNPQRIVGGSLANISQYPSIVALLYSRNLNVYLQYCGGSILNNRSILSAAHCIAGDVPNRWRIRVGSSYANSGGVVHNVGQIIVYPSYNSRSLDNDAGILRSVSEFSFNNNVQPASIAGSNYNLGDHQPVWAAGWGDIYYGLNVGSEHLQHVQMLIINQNVCRQNYASRGLVVSDNMVCSGWPSGGRDQCQGDSGGPLYHNNVVVGVCSFGIGCGEAAFPGVNARVSRFASWISNNA